MKINMPIALDWCLSLTGHWPSVSAEIVDVAPHLAMEHTFAVHPAWGAGNEGKWSVSHLETGFSAEREHPSAKAAIAAARLRLAPLNLRTMGRLVAKQCRNRPDVTELPQEAANR